MKHVPHIQRNARSAQPRTKRPAQTTSPSSPVGRAFSADILRHMQQAQGNRAVQRLLAAHGVQAKPVLGLTIDPCEREAEQISAQVVGGHTPMGRNSIARPMAPSMQAARLNGQEPVDSVHAQRNAAGNIEAGENSETELSEANRGGRPLPDTVRRELEPKFGADFSQVRVHTGPDSARLNKAIGAQAFTQGRHIHMGSGKYQPDSGSGKRLLAHELTHVVQQKGVAQPIIQKKGDGEAAPDTRTAEELQTQADNVLTPDPGSENDAVRDQAPTRHVITVGVFTQNDELLDFIKTRAKSTFRNKARSLFKWMPGVRKAKTAAETKMSSAKRVVKARPGGDQLNNQQLVDEARRLANRANAVGHTWIKLSTFVGDERQKSSSFGLWPVGTVTRPDRSVPGFIRHPDPHRDEPGARQKDFEIAPTNYAKVVAKIQASIKGRIPYNIHTSNCTTFARDMVALAGVNFPVQATVIPYGPFGMFKARLFNPNQLYGDMAGQEGVY